MQQLLCRRLRLPRGPLLSRRSVFRDGLLHLEPVRGRGAFLLGRRRLLHGKLQRRGLPLGLLERSGLRQQRAVLQLLQRRETLRAVLGSAGPSLGGGGNPSTRSAVASQPGALSGTVDLAVTQSFPDGTGAAADALFHDVVVTNQGRNTATNVTLDVPHRLAVHLHGRHRPDVERVGHQHRQHRALAVPLRGSLKRQGP